VPAVKYFETHTTPRANTSAEYSESLEMIKNGHHATSEQRGDVAESQQPRGASGCSPEKRKRVVRLWCDGW